MILIVLMLSVVFALNYLLRDRSLLFLCGSTFLVTVVMLIINALPVPKSF